ncbi:hypothetical protein CPT_Mydo_197 [Proteus phage Mydo]|uniref:Uncharacterized protein n=1 Tax=Proteus phage Mydo TaxID=2483610 RepID=A0A3G8F129_9CAUD|nr:hypothetical protein HWB97_gp258 [Proteus phage Mydo]AZF87767.1 hypothetical protein CPT_Mydo_197 [Proteus phage Mydo]
MQGRRFVNREVHPDLKISPLHTCGGEYIGG